MCICCKEESEVSEIELKRMDIIVHNQMLIHVFENEEEYPFLKKIFEKEIKPTFLKEFKNFIFGSIEL